MTDTDEEQLIQQAQYEYPYHYVPRVEDGRFSQLRYWSWGLHYLGGLRVVLDCLDDITYNSLIDVGCGDGRFLAELQDSEPDIEMFGIDYSERSIAMARGMNPDIEFAVRDLLKDGLNRTFDVVTSIEVLEHIPPADCPAFVEGVVDLLEENGRFLLTVPHENKPVSEKHYQHFTSDQLEELLGQHFSNLEFVPFDRASKVFTTVELALGGRGNHIVINSPIVTNAVWNLYKWRYLYAPTESSCRRLAVVCHR